MDLNIKNKYKEKEMLNMILNHIKQCDNYESLCNNPISIMFGYELLKHELNGYCSFNLNRNKGKDRLIFSAISKSCIRLEYISINHYEDFKSKL